MIDLHQSEYLKTSYLDSSRRVRVIFTSNNIRTNGGRRFSGERLDLIAETRILI
ncbi:hypothetical protein JOB18_040519 [Solea senegalensis]|uniref:Uncharacterized protein n=1 Tax=Solea senegalensis TaxID=28829 RepID=A0AAV6T153_SOLSE|nr:hypothetical protein JOB18_040519 [Solea senegalensis]